MESFVLKVSIILVFFVTLVFCLPLNERIPIITSTDQLEYMQKYGYLRGDPSLGFTEDSIVEAIINLQKSAGIEQTGVFDNKTKELMKKPRCGVKDVIYKSDYTEETILAEASTLRYNSELITESNVHYEDFESIFDSKKDDTHDMSRTYEKLGELCNGIYDTISIIRRELYVFKNTTIWRFQRRGVLYDGYPTSLFHIFPHLPSDIKRIDAAYDNINGDITFFSGNKYWIYDFKNVNAYNLENYSVHNHTRIKAVLFWPYMERTYLFDQNKYWRFDEATNTMDDEYPRTMKPWSRIPDDFDAAICWNDGRIYFFKGKFYWKFDDINMASGREYPRLAPQSWFGCEEQEYFQN